MQKPKLEARRSTDRLYHAARRLVASAGEVKHHELHRTEVPSSPQVGVTAFQCDSHTTYGYGQKAIVWHLDALTPG